MRENEQNSGAVSEFLSEAELAELDGKLAQMAEEAPEVPEDFHARWTEQIRKEAAEKTQNGKKQEGRRQWRYILSAAAVFVFLIGGTLLTRNRGKENAVNRTERNETAAAEIRSEADTGSLNANGSTVYDQAPEAVSYAMEAAEPEEAPMEEAAMVEAAEIYEESAMEADAEEACDGAYAAAGVTEDEAEAAAPVNYAMTADAASEKNAGAESKAALTHAQTEDPVPAQTAATTATAAPAATATEALPTDLPAKETDREDGGFIGFLADLGIFTLKTLAVAAAGLLMMTAVKKIRKKRQGTKGGTE